MTDNQCDTVTDTVNSNLALVAALWPSAAWTDELTSMWSDRLGELRDQALVAKSIRWVRPNYSSYQPELKWILTQYARFYEAKHPAYERSKAKENEIWHVVWRQPSKFGVHTVEYGTVCHDRVMAERIAKERHGRVIEHSNEVTDERLAEEHTWAIKRLISTPRETVRAAVNRLRHERMLKEPLPSDISQWPRQPSFMVLARISL